MKLICGTTFFDKVNKRIKQYPYLDKNLECDILIIGGGIEGAVLNYYLSKNYDVVLAEAKRIGRNSTSVATALLEFQLDKFAKDLANTLTEKEIVKIYSMGRKSIEEIRNFISEHGNSCEFKEKASFLYSDKQKDVKKIKEEYEFRIKHGFECKFFDENNNPFCFDIKAGIYEENGGAEFNPYLFSKQMIDVSKNQNKIFENTKIIRIEQNKKSNFCYTEFGNVIKCKWIILATGFNFELIDKKTVKLITQQVSYSIVTKPVKNLGKINEVLIQDCLENYHYLRSLKDNRLIFGGEDTEFNGVLDEGLAEKKYLSLRKKLEKMLKQNIEIENSFCGLFATTENNLGIIGKSENDKILYFLSCGANGIINTFCGVDIVKDILKGKKNSFEKMFSPKRT